MFKLMTLIFFSIFVLLILPQNELQHRIYQLYVCTTCTLFEKNRREYVHIHTTKTVRHRRRHRCLHNELNTTKTPTREQKSKKDTSFIKNCRCVYQHNSNEHQPFPLYSATKYQYYHPLVISVIFKENKRITPFVRTHSSIHLKRIAWSEIGLK